MQVNELELDLEIFSAASISLSGHLPKGDPRFWAHTMTDLVAAFLRDDKCRNIIDCQRGPLRPDHIKTARDALFGAGIEPGDTVLVEVQNDIQAVASILAVWLMGCVLCPIDPNAPPDVKEQIASQAGACAQVSATGDVSFREFVGKTEGLIRLRTPRKVTGPDLALLIFTSGSSSVPKGVMLSHHNVISALRSISSYLGLVPEDKILCVPPLFFDYGLYQLILTLFDRCTLFLNGNNANTVSVLKMIDEVQPTVLPVVPALASSLARLYKALKKTESNIRLITNTGGHLSGTTIEILAKTFPESNIVPMYGLTECKRALYLAPHLVKDKPTSVGGPMPGLMATVFTMSDDGQRLEAPPGEVGELYVRGPSVMQGYHSDDVEGGARLIKGRYRDDNWLATGDLFSTDDDGLLYFRGRAKALIKQGGYCIFPGDIERIVEKKQDVIAAKVVSGEDENGDEMAVLFIQAAAEADKERKKALIEDIKAGINKTLMPKRVLFVDEWPSTPNGKIDAEALTSLARTK